MKSPHLNRYYAMYDFASLGLCISGRGPGVGVDQRGDGRVAAQLGQAAAPVRADAAGRDAQPGADLGIRHGRVLGEQGDQLLAAGRQVRERLAT